MDLNRSPSSVDEFPSSIDIRIVTRKKTDCRDVLVRKYGEERFTTMIRNPEPVVLPAFINNMIVVFVLYN